MRRTQACAGVFNLHRITAQALIWTNLFKPGVKLRFALSCCPQNTHFISCFSNERSRKHVSVAEQHEDELM